MKYEAKSYTLSQPPIVFSKDHPLVIRPMEPQGFTIETDTGIVVSKCSMPFEQCQFRILNGPAPNTTFEVETTWIE